jgi:FKBP-type peptidyl-prolyl cis-trans isomerase
MDFTTLNIHEKASIAIGASIGQSLKSQDLSELDLTLLMKGIERVFSEKELPFSENEANSAIQEYVNTLKEELHKGTKEEGELFLQQNAKKNGIITTNSGLQYEVLEQGNGEKPTKEDNVSVHYHGTLIDGTVFDSSVDRGQPASFGVQQVISGWTEALQLMATGSKYRLYIPHQLAYGATPHPGGPIKPYSALIFDVELLSVN